MERAYKPTPNLVQGHTDRCPKQAGTKSWCLRGLGYLHCGHNLPNLLFHAPSLPAGEKWAHSDVSFQAEMSHSPANKSIHTPCKSSLGRGSPLPWLPQNHMLVLPGHQISAFLGWQPWWSTALPLAPACHRGAGHPCPWGMWPPTAQTTNPAVWPGSSPPPTLLWCNISSPLFVWRTPLCRES